MISVGSVRRLVFLAFLFISSCGGSAPKAPIEAPETAESRRLIERLESTRQFVTGKTSAEGKNSTVCVVKMKRPFKGMDGAYEIVVKKETAPGDGFELEIANVEYNVVYGVLRFRDADGDGTTGIGEAMEWARARTEDGELRAIFIFTAGGTFIDDRVRDLAEAEFFFAGSF